MDAIERRDILAPQANPNGSRDYVVILRGERAVSANGPVSATVILRYVPDRFVLPVESFQAYLDRIAGIDWPSLEAAAAAVLDDIANEVLARWSQVTLRVADEDGSGGHEIAMEDHQPGWHNEDLLYRLPPV
jgi:NADPH-dependent 7-cyano-7-deazaguanine reductase QueF